jgi:hypothetical protein
VLTRSIVLFLIPAHQTGRADWSRATTHGHRPAHPPPVRLRRTPAAAVRSLASHTFGAAGVRTWRSALRSAGILACTATFLSPAGAPPGEKLSKDASDFLPPNPAYLEGAGAMTKTKTRPDRTRTLLAVGVLLCVLLLTGACGGSRHTGVSDLSGREDLSHFRLDSLRGTRTGDHLETEATFTDGPSVLTMNARFIIGTPTALESGTWRWTRSARIESGPVAARSVTFLGGQSGPPSIGGTFDLLVSDGPARYRVTIPVSELRAHLKHVQPAL